MSYKVPFFLTSLVILTILTKCQSLSNDRFISQVNISYLSNSYHNLQKTDQSYKDFLLSIDGKRLDNRRELGEDFNPNYLQSEVMYINSLLRDKYFIGTWNSSSYIKPTNFTQFTGLVYLDYTQSYASDGEISFDLYIYDGKYTDANFFKITIWINIIWLNEIGGEIYLQAGR